MDGKSIPHQIGYARGVSEIRGHGGIPYGWPEAELLGLLEDLDYKLGYRDGKNYARIHDE